MRRRKTIFFNITDREKKDLIRIKSVRKHQIIFYRFSNCTAGNEGLGIAKISFVA